MIDVTGYTGNAGLGLGANPNIPVSASPNSLDVLNQASRDIAAWANQQNAMLFRQKVADRDNALEMIANDQISTGGILPEYLPDIEKAKEEQIKAFREWRGNPNDIDGAMKYKQAFQKASDLAKVAQINTLGIQDVRKQRAAEPVKYRQSDYDKFEKQELSKGLTDIVSPYQKVMYSDIPGMGADLNQGAFIPGGGIAAPTDTTQKTTVTDTGGKQKVTQTTTTKPATGKGSQPVSLNPDGTPSLITKQPDKQYNYDNVLGRATVRFLERGPWAEQQELTIEGVQNAPAPQARAFLESINDRIRLYNEQTKGRAMPVKELKEGEDFAEVADPNGNKRVLLKVNTPEFAAKVALAQHPGNYFEPGAQSINKDVADYLNDNEKLKIDREKLGISRQKANAYIDNLRAKTKKLMDDGIDENKVKLVIDQFSEDFSLGDVVERTQGGKKSIVGDVNTFFIDKVPTGYRNVIGPVYDSQGKITTKPLAPFTNQKQGREYLKGIIYSSDGKEFNTDYKSLQQKYKESVKNGYGGSWEEYKIDVQGRVREGIRNGTFNLMLEDKNGSKVTPNSILDAYKAINNAAASKKGQEQLFVEETTTEDEE